MLIAGAALYLAARIRFRSFRLTWGLDTSCLITTGVYRISRNPQTLGAIIVLAGAALSGNCTVALLLSGVMLVGSMIWLPKEEEILQRRFGEQYRRYRKCVPRFFGWPGHEQA